MLKLELLIVTKSHVTMSSAKQTGNNFEPPNITDTAVGRYGSKRREIMV